MDGGFCDAVRGCCCRRRIRDDADAADEKDEPLLEDEKDEREDGPEGSSVVTSKSVAFAEDARADRDEKELNRLSSLTVDEPDEGNKSSSSEGPVVRETMTSASEGSKGTKEKKKHLMLGDLKKGGRAKGGGGAARVSFDEQQLEPLERAQRSSTDSADGRVFGGRGQSSWLKSATVIDAPENLDDDVIRSLRDMPCDDRDSLLESLMKKEGKDCNTGDL